MVSYRRWWYRVQERRVLILIVMDNGLLLSPKGEILTLDPNVLILIVMDNGLLHTLGEAADRLSKS